MFWGEEIKLIEKDLLRDFAFLSHLQCNHVGFGNEYDQFLSIDISSCMHSSVVLIIAFQFDFGEVSLSRFEPINEYLFTEELVVILGLFNAISWFFLKLSQKS